MSGDHATTMRGLVNMRRADDGERPPGARPAAAPAEEQPGPDLSAVRSAAPSPKIASVLTAAVFLGYLFMQVVNILAASSHNGWQLATCLVLLPLLVAIQYLHSAPRAERLRRRLAPWSLVVQAAATFVPFVAFGWQWGGMAGFLSASLLLMLPAVVGWSLFALTVTAVVAVSTAHAMTFVDIAYMGVSTTLTGLVLFALARLVAVAVAIHDSRDEIARMAVARERLRFARDLHDLLGYSLSSITLKNELIHRLIEHNPQRAREEVAEVLDISRQALSDVREVARGYRDMSLLVEAHSARSVLSAAGIDARVDVSCTGLSSTTNTILATVLREGVTNLLRHSQPKNCAIQTSTEELEGFVRLHIVNDGVGAGRAVDIGSAGPGTGLRNLATRVEAVGGELHARSAAGGRFQLSVRIPATAHATEGRPARQVTDLSA
ncbi:histidine kinase [Streptomyces sp. DSM 42041]|uniref:Histidine kinase n=1 Tax=Streptomyces hazeniae TaxID=3075538 RepID=A0ABU2NN77_9ACTN|nr:histidine kinase [Streptomyces sp. DSM 42041]MDT0378435.1 histidine kinase [Streptomyces sp. DSM 42041]